MYCIFVPDPTAFSATTCAGTTVDTQLCLFDMGGLGVSFNDDDPAGCGLQSTVTGAFMSMGGTHLLAISSYDWDPASPAGDIWQDTPYNVERAPDGPGAAGAITGWGGIAFGTGPYTIFLTGAQFCQVPTSVETSTWGHIKSLYR